MNDPADAAVLGVSCPLRPLDELPRVFDVLVQAGFASLYLPDVFCFPCSRQQIRQIRRMLKQAGLNVHGAHFGPILPPPWQTMGWMLDEHERCLDLAAEFGIRIVTTHFGWMRGLDDPRLLPPRLLQRYRSAIQKYAPRVYTELYRRNGGRQRFMDMNRDVYRHLASEGRQRGITPTIETACCNLTRTPARIIRLIRDIDAANLGICLDAGHCHVMGVDPGRAARQAGAYLMETHVHDNFGDRDLHNPVGIGTIDWRAVIKALAAIPYRGVVHFEMTAPIGGRFLEDARMNAVNWRRFVDASRAPA